jgi:ATP-dependent Clp protease ATP-binding subunit ClpA
VIQNRIEDPLAEGMLNQKFTQGSTIRVDAADDEITLERIEELVLA